MNSNISHRLRLVAVGRILALLVVGLVVVLAAQVVWSWLAPIVAVPLLVVGWLVGFGLVIVLPFAIVAAGAWVVAR